MNVKFTYFDAPIDDIRVPSDSTLEEYLTGLRNKSVKQFIETSIGTLEEGLISKFDIEKEEIVEVKLPNNFHPNAIHELTYTPVFKSKQVSYYPINKNDFMVYIGRWLPSDFIAIAGDNDPRDFFIECCEDSQLWDETTEKQKLENVWNYDSWVYMFKCKHTNKLSCYWDCE